MFLAPPGSCQRMSSPPSLMWSSSPDTFRIMCRGLLFLWNLEVYHWSGGQYFHRYCKHCFQLMMWRMQSSRSGAPLVNCFLHLLSWFSMTKPLYLWSREHWGLPVIVWHREGRRIIVIVFWRNLETSSTYYSASKYFGFLEFHPNSFITFQVWYLELLCCSLWVCQRPPWA